MPNFEELSKKTQEHEFYNNFPDGYKRCSADQTQILSCVGEKMALEKACSGGQSCLVVVEQGLTVPGCH